MNSLQLLARGAALCLLLGIQSFAQGTSTNTNTVTVAAQWDFNQGDLRATVGTNLIFLDSTADLTSFEDAQINGSTAKVMRFPAATPQQGFFAFHNLKPNGGGTNVNEYTIIMDLMWPAESDGTFRALFNSHTNNSAVTDDAIMFVNPDNAIGVQNDYAGVMDPETWYRVAFSFDLTNGVITRYLNGTNIGSIFVGANAVDSEYSLGPALLFFTDNDGETASGLVNSIQIVGQALTDEQVAALGGPTSGGIGVPDNNPPGGDLKIDSIRQDGTNFVITVSGGGNVQLERKVKLDDAIWQNAGAASSSGTFTVPAGTNASSFFRAKRL